MPSGTYDLIGITNQLIDADFMPADHAPEDLAWIAEFGYVADREEANGSLTLIMQADATVIPASTSRNYLYSGMPALTRPRGSARAASSTEGRMIMTEIKYPNVNSSADRP